jgi:ferric-dicitrate binding protein FerR (iron transport regulator)
MRASDIEERYLDGSITPEELQELRAQLNAESDDVVGQRMQERWEGYEYEGGIGEDELDSMWDKISSRAANDSPKPQNSWRWLRVAAAIAVPLLLFSSIYYYHKSSVLSSAEIAIATGDGERATITLPDGTFVNLNEKSTLRYDSKSFNSTKRHVDFDGEAFFKVSKDAKHPFTIDADKLNVTVLGTEFNLMARTNEHSAILALSEGKTALTALTTGRKVILTPNHKAVLEKDAGTISVEDMNDDFMVVTAWRHKQIMFRDAPMRDVLKTLEDTFKVKFVLNGQIDMDDVFTGTMSDADLNIDLSILEELYDLNAQRVGDTVTLTED